MDKLQECIANSPLVRAAITEAVHRFYYDRVLSDKKEDREDLAETNAANILDKLWNLLPNWRHILHTIPARYKGFDTNAVSIHGRPKDVSPFTVSEIIFP